MEFARDRFLDKVGLSCDGVAAKDMVSTCDSPGVRGGRKMLLCKRPDC
jgi:hypothetical protein